MDPLGDLLKGPSGKLEKLKIFPQKPGQSKVEFDHQTFIAAQFNPNTFTVTKQVHWNPVLDTGRAECEPPVDRQVNAPQLQFDGGQSRTITFDLFFDVTEKPDDIRDVRQLTNAIVALTCIEPGRGQPPLCMLEWGSELTTTAYPFLGVITNLQQRFTLFRSDGRPVRATLGVTFTEWCDVVQDKKETDPDFTSHVVTRGETLSAIAAKLYNNPALWRAIAEMNGIDDPRRLEAGRRLAIPKL